MDWKLLKWKLHENYGVHTLFMDGTPMEINMLVEKKYPLIKELLEKVLNLQLEAKEENLFIGTSQYGHVSRECQKPKRPKDATYHKENMFLCKQEEAEVRLNAEQADRKEDTDDESDNQELEAHYMYMAQIQEVTPDAVENSGPIFDVEPLQKVQNNNDNYNVFAAKNEHPKQPESVNDTYLEEQGDTNITIDSLDMCYDREQDDQDDTDELDQERDLLASLIEKLKCEIDDNKNHNKFLESSNHALVDKLKDLKKFQAELDKYHDVNYASKVAIDCAKAKGDLMSYKIESEKSSNEYTRKINDLNQIISDMKKELFAHQETISIISQEKEVWICQILQEISQKRTRERMSDQEAKEKKKSQSRSQRDQPHLLWSMNFYLSPDSSRREKRWRAKIKEIEGSREDGNMKIYVETIFGKRIPVDVNFVHTAKELKALIQDKEGTHPDQQTLVYAGNKLDRGRLSP
ncbi:copia protein [Tanacetum coccineum]